MQVVPPIPREEDRSQEQGEGNRCSTGSRRDRGGYVLRIAGGDHLDQAESQVPLSSRTEPRYAPGVNMFAVRTVPEIRKSVASSPQMAILILNRARKKKYPDGYPGDAPSSDTSKPVKYACHKCSKVFPPVPHPDTPEGKAFRAGDPLPCVRCQHPLCGDCPRAPPQKVEPTPDPEVFKSVQSKLAALNISTSAVPA